MAESREQALNFSKACESFRSKTVGGRTIITVLLEYRGREDLNNRIDQSDIEIMYVSRPTPDLCKEVINVTRSLKVLSFTSGTDNFADCGISMTVGLENQRPKIFLNLAASRAEGADFSAKFLRISHIINAAEGGGGKERP